MLKCGLDVQKRKSNKGHKSNSLSPVYPELHHRCTSESQLHVPKANHSHLGILVNGRIPAASAYCQGYNGTTGGGHNHNGHSPCERSKSVDVSRRDSDSTRTSTTSPEPPTCGNMPNVSRLRNYFENLEEESRRESIGFHSGSLKRGM